MQAMDALAVHCNGKVVFKICSQLGLPAAFSAASCWPPAALHISL